MLDHVGYLVRDLDAGVELVKRAFAADVTRTVERPQWSLFGYYVGEIEVFTFTDPVLLEERLGGAVRPRECTPPLDDGRRDRATTDRVSGVACEHGALRQGRVRPGRAGCPRPRRDARPGRGDRRRGGAERRRARRVPRDVRRGLSVEPLG